MNYRAAYEQIICALFKFDKDLGDAHTNLMLEVQRIENNIDKVLPPIQFVKPQDKEND